MDSDSRRTSQVRPLPRQREGSIFLDTIRRHRASRRDSRLNRPVHSTFVQFQRHRRNFIVNVYFFATSFICLTFVQWMIVILNDDLRDFFEEAHYMTFLLGLVGLLLLSVFTCIDEIRYQKPYNWIIALLIVECVTVGLLRVFVYTTELGSVIQCLLITVAIFLGFILIGLGCKRDLTQDVVILDILSLLFYLVTVVVVVVVVLTENTFPILICIAMILALLLMYIMYFAQLISGRRAGTIRWHDYILASLMLYLTFVLLFSLIFFLSGALQDNPLK